MSNLAFSNFGLVMQNLMVAKILITLSLMT